MRLISLYTAGLRMKNIRLYTPKPDFSWSAPVLSFNIEGRHSEEVADALSKKGIAVRAGLHCAPNAHRKFGTLDTGTVRGGAFRAYHHGLKAGVPVRRDRENGGVKSGLPGRGGGPMLSRVSK